MTILGDGKPPLLIREPQNFEEALEKVGSFHRYQAVLYLTFFLGHLCVGGNVLFMAFGNLVPKWRCAGDSNSTYGSDCSLLTHCGEGIEFKSDSGFFSVVQDFQLLCDLSYVPSLMVSVQMSGVFVGALGGGQGSDSWGRKPAFLTVLLSQIILGISSSFLPTWQTFIALRFFIGVFSGAQMTISFTFVLEQFGTSRRLWVRAMGATYIAQMWLSFLAYMIPQWRTLSIVLNAQSILAVPLLWFILSESPRWLLTHGKRVEFEKAMNNIARINRRSPLSDSDFSRLEPPSVYSRTHRSSGQSIGLHSKKMDQSLVVKQEYETRGSDRKYTFWHLFSSRKLGTFTTVLGLCWFTSSLISYHLQLNMKDFFGNPMLIQATFGLFGWFAVLLSIFLDSKFKIVGRKFILTYSLLTPLLCFVIIPIYLIATGQTGNAALNTPMTILVVMGDAMNQGAWLAEYHFSAELFPTVVRSISTGFCAGMARLGAILSPYIGNLRTIWAPSSYIILGALTAISLVLSLIFLEETKGKSLPEVMQDVETPQQKMEPQ